MSLTLIKKTGLFDTFLLKYLCAHTKSCTFAPEKEKRIKDYGNGSIVYDLKNEERIYEKFLSQKKVLQLIKICEENSIYYSICTEKGIITKSLNYNVLFYNHEKSTEVISKDGLFNWGSVLKSRG